MAEAKKTRKSSIPDSVMVDPKALTKHLIQMKLERFLSAARGFRTLLNGKLVRAERDKNGQIILQDGQPKNNVEFPFLALSQNQIDFIENETSEALAAILDQLKNPGVKVKKSMVIPD